MTSNAPSAAERVALVTGAGGAIGAAIAGHLARQGAVVAAVDVSADPVKAAADRLAEDGQQVHAYTADVSDEAQVEALVEQVLDERGRLDYLVNNAGITRDATLHKMSFEQWRDVMAVNLDGPFLLTRATARHFRERGDGGRVVNMSSISGKLGNFGQGNYAASKAGLVALTKVTARELARYSVTANAIMPGFISTPMTEAMPDDIREERAKAAPLGRPGTTDEVAATVAWLCSDAAAYITGATIEVTGGRGM